MEGQPKQPYNKLVRDKIPEQLRAKGISYEEERIASDEEYEQELIKKAFEEASEFFANPTVEELADMQEVINALSKLAKYENLEEVRRAKFDDKGGFERKIILKGEK